jgi:hypothetical protein
LFPNIRLSDLLVNLLAWRLGHMATLGDMRMTQSTIRALTPPANTPQASTDNGAFTYRQIAQLPWPNTFFQ